MVKADRRAAVARDGEETVRWRSTGGRVGEEAAPGAGRCYSAGRERRGLNGPRGQRGPFT